MVSRAHVYDKVPLHHPEKYIRILRLEPNDGRSKALLRGKLEVVALADHPKFAALSYVWSNNHDEHVADKTRNNIIYCNDAEVRVEKNCYDALNSLRNICGAVDIWVDAISINQQDEVEKASQIGLMTDIYTWAKTVYVWLGPGSNATERAIDCLEMASRIRVYYPGIPWASEKCMSFRQDMFCFLWTTIYFQIMAMLPCKVSTSQNSKQLANRKSGLQWLQAYRVRKLFNPGDVHELLDNKWTQRAWAYQEIVYASNPVVVCGEKAITWSGLQRGINYFDIRAPPFKLSTIYTLRPAHLRVILVQWANIIDLIEPLHVTKELKESFHIWRHIHFIWMIADRKAMWDNETLRILPATSKVVNFDRWSVAKYQEEFNNVCGLFVTVGALVLGTVISFMWFMRKTWFPCFLYCPFLFNGQILSSYDSPATKFLAAGSIACGCLLVCRIFLVVPAEIFDKRHTSTDLLACLTQALREREATLAADKAFALHKVSGNFDIQFSTRADYQQPVGKVYHMLFLDLLRQSTTFINLLIDSKGPETFSDVPSWVPDWRETHKNEWGQSDFIYKHINFGRERLSKPQMMISSTRLGLWAIRKGVIRKPLSEVDTKLHLSGKDGFNTVLTGSFTRCVSDAFKDIKPRILTTGSNTANGKYGSSYKALTGRMLPSQEHRNEEARLLDKWIDLSRRTSRPESSLFTKFSDNEELEAFMIGCYRPAHNRFLFVTTEGHYGMGPRGMTAGDQLMWLRGVAIPMVLRETGEGGNEFQIIGPAVVPGLMDLSALNGADFGSNWEVIHLL